MLKRIPLWLIILFFSILLNMPILRIPINTYDEGLILTGALRVLQGFIPYRDFWSNYPPGNIYVLAFLFHVFGQTILVGRIYELAIKSLLGLTIFLVSRKASGSTKVAAFSWALAMAWLPISFPFPLYPVGPALLLVLLGVFAYLRYWGDNRLCWLIFSGLLVGSSAVFRHDLFFYTMFSFLLSMAIGRFYHYQQSILPMVWFVLSVMVATLPLALYFTFFSGWETSIEQLVFTPARVMSRYRSLPLIRFNQVTFHVVALFSLMVGGCLLSWNHLRGNKSGNPNPWMGYLVLSLIGFFFLNQVRVRTDLIHSMPCAMVACLTGAFWLGRVYSRLSRNASPKRKVIITCLAGIVCILALFPAINWRAENLSRYYLSWSDKPPIQRAGWSSMSKNLMGVIQFLQQNFKGQPTIFVGCKNNDQFIVNQPVIYFLTNSRYSTKYHHFEPGVITTPEVQKEIVSELKRYDVEAIVLDTGYWYEENETKYDDHLDILDNFIKNTYVLVREFGDYQVLLKKEPPHPRNGGH